MWQLQFNGLDDRVRYGRVRGSNVILNQVQHDNSDVRVANQNVYHLSPIDGRVPEEKYSWQLKPLES